MNRITRRTTIAWIAQSTALLLTITALSGRPVSGGTVVGGYPFSAFMLTNDSGDGSAVPGPGLVLTGPNTGSGEPGSTRFTTTIVADQVLAFHYLFQTDDDPGMDEGGYLIDSTPFKLADENGQSGDVNVPVHTGQQFGFYVSSLDNQFFPGVLVVSGQGEAPEPGTVALVLTGALLLASTRLFGKCGDARRP
jgi:hypothetical protein